MTDHFAAAVPARARARIRRLIRAIRLNPVPVPDADPRGRDWVWAEIMRERIGNLLPARR